MNISSQVFVQTLIKLIGAYLCFSHRVTDAEWQPVAGALMVLIGFCWSLGHAHLLAGNNPTPPPAGKLMLLAAMLAVSLGFSGCSTAPGGWSSGNNSVCLGVSTNRIGATVRTSTATNRFNLILPINIQSIGQALLSTEGL